MTDYRCSALSRHRGEPVAGTASTYRSFLLVEEPGPWGESVWRDSRLPASVRDEVVVRTGAIGMRPLLIRQQHRPAQSSARQVFVATTDPASPVGGARLESGVLDDVANVLDLDLAGFVSGRTSGLDPHSEPVFAVCTHGKHDACCAERGRPVLAALADAEPDAAWGVSHIGGDRFAANMLVLAGGLYYGGLDADSVIDVAREHRAGRLAPDHLRGRSCWAPSIQSAEIALRQHLSVPELDALTYRGRSRHGDEVVVRFVVGGAEWTVTVRRSEGEPMPLTCHARHAEPPVSWLPRAIESSETQPPRDAGGLGFEQGTRQR